MALGSKEERGRLGRGEYFFRSIEAGRSLVKVILLLLHFMILNFGLQEFLLFVGVTLHLYALNFFQKNPDRDVHILLAPSLRRPAPDSR